MRSAADRDASQRAISAAIAGGRTGQSCAERTAMEVFIVLFLAFQNLRVPARDVRLAGALRGNGP